MTDHASQDPQDSQNIAPGTSPSDQEPGQTDQLEECRKQRDEYLAGWQRAKADFLNYKKEEIMRLQEMARYANGEFAQEFLDVLDNFDLAIGAMGKAGEVDRGIYMIRAQIEDILKRYGVRKATIAPGDTFDPAVAEALIEVESEIPAGKIVEEVKAGYFLHDKLLRPARVKVSKGRGETV